MNPDLVQLLAYLALGAGSYLAGHYKLFGGGSTAPATSTTPTTAPAVPTTSTPSTLVALAAQWLQSQQAQQLEAHVLSQFLATLQGAAPAAPTVAMPTASAPAKPTTATPAGSPTTAAPSTIVALLNEFQGNQNLAKAEQDAVKAFLADVQPATPTVPASVATGS